MTDEVFKLTLLEAAISHARKNARTPQDRRERAIFYVRTIEKDLIRRRDFTHAGIARRLVWQMTAAPLLSSLLESSRQELGITRTDVEVPLSNTGPTNEGASANVQESTHIGTLAQQTIEAYIGGHNA